MGLCSDTSWKRLQERRAARAEADAAARADRARMAERLSGLTAAYEGRAVDRIRSAEGRRRHVLRTDDATGGRP